MNAFTHHLKFALRNIFKSKIYSLFNILGFAMGFTICLITGLYIYREFKVDKSYKDYEHIYRIVDDEKNLSQIDYDLAERLRNQFPEIKQITPVHYNHTYELLVKRPEGENYISIQNIISTESDFFDIFPINLISGNPADPFNSGFGVVITKSITEKLFGHTDVIGELINTELGDIPITAVIEGVPENSSLKADIIINSGTGQRMTSICKGGNEVCYNPYPIYMSLNKETNIKLLEEKINNHFPENLSDTKKIRLQPLADIYFDKTVSDNQNIPGSHSMVFIFITIAVIVLMLSVINYINFALSQQLDTLRQLGVKITYGASMRQLRAYYLVEIGLSILLSFLLSLIISAYSLPLFEEVLGVPLNMWNIFTPVFLLSILTILGIVILISALTPFYIISKFDVQVLFGKKQTYFGKQRGKMVLTGCQMAITVIMFVCLFMLHKQLGYVKNYDLGFDKNHLARMENIPSMGYEAFQNEISQYDFVKNITGSWQAPAFMDAWEEQPHEQGNRSVRVNKIYTEPGFLETFNLELLYGRDFTNADRGKACIISEETMRQFSWENIEGKICNGHQVIGVVKDFNISSLHNRMEPVNIIPIMKEDIIGAPLAINIRGNIPEALDKLQLAWEKIFPGIPFHLRFYNEVFDAYYEKEERQSKAIGIISVIAIVITCMGLIGQVKQTSLSKAKEIGLRKINGATIVEMMLVIPKNFLKIFTFAFIMAIPIAWYAMEKWLENFAFKTAISWWVFALSGIVVFTLLTLFVLWQTWKAATANPIDIIKTE